MTISGAGDLALTTNNNLGGKSSGGVLTFTMGEGSVQYTGGHGAGARLSIDGQPYTLLYDMTTNPWGVQSMNGSSGNFALATSVTAPTTLTPRARGSRLIYRQL